MKMPALAVAAVCLMGLTDSSLPALHAVRDVSLSPSYSCRPAEEVAKGYQGTALFLSAHSKQRNSPDLVFNGACGSENYFQASTAGDDMSLIADLGPGVSLEEVSASRAFRRARFSRTVSVRPDHTYAVLLNERDKRGLFIFTVTEYVPDKRVSLSYAVKSYEVMRR